MIFLSYLQVFGYIANYVIKIDLLDIRRIQVTFIFLFSPPSHLFAVKADEIVIVLHSFAVFCSFIVSSLLVNPLKVVTWYFCSDNVCRYVRNVLILHLL